MTDALKSSGRTTTSRRQFFRRGVLFAVSLAAAGCISPLTTRFPAWCPRPAELERRESQIFDPYPDPKMGPDVGARPLEYQDQRSEAQRAKDGWEAGFLLQRNGPPQPAPVPIIPPGAYLPGPYPVIVR